MAASPRKSLALDTNLLLITSDKRLLDVDEDALLMLMADVNG